jgi:hypothetical protein
VHFLFLLLSQHNNFFSSGALAALQRSYEVSASIRTQGTTGKSLVGNYIFASFTKNCRRFYVYI